MDTNSQKVYVTPRHVLVVEDDFGLLRLILKLLNNNGFVASGVSFGSEAIAHVADNPDILLLIDQKLPDMKGSDVICALTDRAIKVPFVMMTGQGDEKLAVEMMKLGAADYLVKDIDFLDVLPSLLDRVFRNIETEKKLQKAQEDLRQREMDLRISEAKLKELNDTKDKFFSIIAHDLRGYFGGIVGFSELMIHKSEINDYQKVNEYSARLYDVAGKGFALLENLLHWARHQSGRLDFKPSPVLLYDILSNAVDIYAINLEKKQISLKVLCKKDLRVNLDSSMIETVIRNLVSNAIKFSNLGGEILLKVQETKNEVRVSVSDKGIGISDEEIKKLFRIEINHEAIGNGEEKGTGLGLILSREFIERHRGELRVESELGKGSTFTFTLPK